jgi:hypothetical protein
MISYAVPVVWIGFISFPQRMPHISRTVLRSDLCRSVVQEWLGAALGNFRLWL